MPKVCFLIDLLLSFEIFCIYNTINVFHKVVFNVCVFMSIIVFVFFFC